MWFNNLKYFKYIKIKKFKDLSKILHLIMSNQNHFHLFLSMKWFPVNYHFINFTIGYLQDHFYLLFINQHLITLYYSIQIILNMSQLFIFIYELIKFQIRLFFQYSIILFCLLIQTFVLKISWLNVDILHNLNQTVKHTFVDHFRFPCNQWILFSMWLNVHVSHYSKFITNFSIWILKLISFILLMIGRFCVIEIFHYIYNIFLLLHQLTSGFNGSFHCWC